LIKGVLLKQQPFKDFPYQNADAYLRWRFKHALARVEPPSKGRQRLLEATINGGPSKGSRFGFLLALIETQNFTGIQKFDIWVQVSHFPMEVLSAYRLA